MKLKRDFANKMLNGKKLLSAHNLVFLTAITSLVTMIVTFGGLYFGLKTIIQASKSLEETKRADQGNLILSLNRDFFFNDRLYSVRKAIEDNVPILIENHGKLTDQDLDDYIGIFETMDGLRARKIVDSSLLDENFCVFISEAYNNVEVKSYITQVRNDANQQDIYSGFENLAKNECNK